MKTNSLLAVVALAGLLAHRVVAQDKPVDAREAAKAAHAASRTNSANVANPGTPADQGDAMKKMMELGSPGPGHKVLGPLASEWTVVSTFRMAPGAVPIESKGTSKKHWILGGRFLQEEFDGDMGGMPFQGMGLTGYDNMKKRYVGLWTDTMGTAMSTSEGIADPADKVITMEGTMDDQATGAMNKKVKYVLKIVGPNKHIMEIHDPSWGADSKWGEIVYTKK